MVSPVVASRRAHAGPIWAGALRTPKPGISPIVASLNANFARSDAIAMSHARVSSVPPPYAMPLTAAITIVSARSTEWKLSKTRRRCRR